MQQKELADRVENLEKTVASLTDLPSQMKALSLQFVQLRQDVRADVSAIRGEVAELRGEVGELRSEVTELRGEVTELRGDVTELRRDVTEIRGDVIELRGDVTELAHDLRAKMASMHHELASAILANGVQMRALHEDLLERIKLLGEGRT